MGFLRPSRTLRGYQGMRGMGPLPSTSSSSSHNIVTFADIMGRTDTSCDISVLAYQPFQAKKSTVLLAVEYV
jgi:hypothetical protein